MVQALAVWRRLSGTQNLREKENELRSGKVWRHTHTPEGMFPAAASLTLSALASFLCIQKGQGPEYSAWVPSGQHPQSSGLTTYCGWGHGGTPEFRLSYRHKRHGLHIFSAVSFSFHLSPHTLDLDPTSQCTKLTVATSYDEPQILSTEESKNLQSFNDHFSGNF